MSVRLAALHSYPLKSGRGIAHDSALLTARGLAHDREWLLVDARDRFLTQRELPRLATLTARAQGDELRVAAPGLAELSARGGARRLVHIWGERCAALDAGDAVAATLSHWLGHGCRLVRFAPDATRLSDRQWTGDVAAANAFSDGFPLLLLNRASLTDLNRRLDRALPADRFRANLVYEGLEPYDEDRVAELVCGPVVLRAVKPCTRCVITTTDQARGERDGEEPLRVLRSYRYDAALRGVTFCQNLIVVAGAGETLAVGSHWQVRWK